MTLILAIVPVLLLIVLMAFFKMPGDKSSVISLIVTILIALFGFHYAVDNLVFSFVSNNNSLPSLPIKVSRYCSLPGVSEGYLKPWQVLVQLLPSPPLS